MVMAVGYDKKEIHHQLLLDIPFREGTGVLARDRAKPHHDPITLGGTLPAWTTIASGLSVLDFNGAGDYLDCPAADTADLDFTTEDYSIVVWTNHQATVQSQMLIARYGVDLDGWELYLYDNPPNHYLTLRHHHASLGPDLRDGCYSVGWSNNSWYLLGISRSGLYPRHFRNGAELEVTYETGGLKDPDTCNRDLIIGCRFTKDADWYKGLMWRPRVWGNRSLTPEEHRFIFETERHWFGV